MKSRFYCAACAISLSLAVMLLSGCQIFNPQVPPAAPSPSPAGTNESMMNKNEGMMKKGEEMMKNTNTMMKDKEPTAKSSYVPFTKAAYEQAKAAGQPIMLYFYANWCPLCRPQEPIIQDLFAGGEVADWGIAAFRVNYADSDTDTDERALANQLDVTYQHTFIFFDGNGRQVNKFIGTRTADQLKTELTKIK